MLPISPIWTESNEFSDINCWITGLQNCINEIAEIFDIFIKLHGKFHEENRMAIFNYIDILIAGQFSETNSY